MPNPILMTPTTTQAITRWSLGAGKAQSAVWYRAMATRLHIAALVYASHGMTGRAESCAYRAREAAAKAAS